MKNKKLNYGNTKLTLGIVNVGFWVTFSFFHFFNLLDTNKFFTDINFNFLNILSVFSIYIITQFIFDIFGGIIIPGKFHRVDEGNKKRIINILRASITHYFILSLTGYTLMYITINCGFLCALFSIFLLQNLLIIFQFQIAKLISGIQTRSYKNNFLIIHDASNEITSTISGFLFYEKFLISKNYLSKISNESFNLIKERYEYISKNNLRTKSIFYSIIFNLIGFSISFMIVKPDSILNLTLFISLTSIYAFFGLLILPHLTHKETIRIDKSIIDSKNLEEFKNLITFTNSYQSEKQNRSITEDNIFQPLVSVNKRISSLDENSNNSLLSGWNLCRITTYLSISNISLIGRSVHGNVGRPDLWILLPSD